MQKCIHLHEAIQIALRGAEKLDISGDLEILLELVSLLGVGGKLGENCLAIWFFWYAKNGMGNQIVVGDSTGGENNWIFGYRGGPQSSSRENPDMYTEKS